MLTEEQEKALLEEIEKLRQDKAALISRVSSLERWNNPFTGSGKKSLGG